MSDQSILDEVLDKEKTIWAGKIENIDTSIIEFISAKNWKFSHADGYLRTFVIFVSDCNKSEVENLITDSTGYSGIAYRRVVHYNDVWLECDYSYRMCRISISLDSALIWFRLLKLNIDKKISDKIRKHFNDLM